MTFVTNEVYNQMWQDIIQRLRNDPDEIDSILSEETIKDVRMRASCLHDTVMIGITMPYLVKLLAEYVEDEKDIDPVMMNLHKLRETCLSIGSCIIGGMPPEFAFGDVAKREVVKTAFANIPSPVWIYFMANFDEAITDKVMEVYKDAAHSEHS